MAHVSFVPRKPTMAILVSLLMCIVLSIIAGVESNNAKKTYYAKLGPYFEHDIVAGSNATDQVVVPRGNTTFGFGALRVIDNALTTTINPNSTTIGHVRGFGVVDSLDGASYILVYTLVLPNGTFTCVGPYVTTEPGMHKTACNGGTGEYSSVTRGYVEDNQIYMAPNGLDSINTINIYYHKDDSASY